MTREEQDAFAARSHQRAAAAAKNGALRRRDRAGGDPAAQGRAGAFAEDEGVRGDTTAEIAGRLRPAFAKDGTITAGSASQISDGACAVVVMSRAKAEELGLPWLAEIGAHGIVAGPDTSLQSQPANAISKALRARTASTVADLDLVEINEAFAAVGSSLDARARRLPTTCVNVNGGAIALGHPIGASGARSCSPRARAAPPRRRPRRGRAVRRRRPGRRAAAPRPDA